MITDNHISASVRIQQAIQRLERWHRAAPGREFTLAGSDARQGPSDPRPFVCYLEDVDGREWIEYRDSLHEAIDAALDAAGAPA